MELSSRRTARVLVGANTQATITFGTSSLRCKLLQVSAGGLLLGIDPTLVPADRFEVTFRLPNSSTLYAIVEVRHRLNRGGFRLDSDLGTLGCSFDSPPPGVKDAISTFVDQQRQTLKQLQFSLALVPPSPKVKEYATRVGVAEPMPVTQLQQFVTWSIKQLSV